MVSWRNEGSPLRLLNGNRPLKHRPDMPGAGESEPLHSRTGGELLYDCDNSVARNVEGEPLEESKYDDPNCNQGYENEIEDDIYNCKISHEEKEGGIQGGEKAAEMMDIRERRGLRSDSTENASFPAAEVVKCIFDQILDDVFNRNFNVASEDQDFDSNSLGTDEGSKLKAGELEDGESESMKGENQNEGNVSPLPDSLGRVLLTTWWQEFLQSRSVVFKCWRGMSYIFIFLMLFRLSLHIQEWGQRDC